MWDPLDIILNFRDNDGNNVLMWASALGYTELVKLCLDLGVNKNFTNNIGETAIHWANASNNTEIVSILSR